MSGPAPSSSPALPDDFLQQARREVRCRTASHQAVQRSQLALLLHDNPALAHDEAGRRVGLSGRQVRRWRQRWAAGNFSLADAPGRGCQAGFSPPGSRLG
jgi:hypothetical protein